MIAKGVSPLAIFLPASTVIAAAWLLGLPRLRDDPLPHPIAALIGVIGGVALFRAFAGCWPNFANLRRFRVMAAASTYLSARSVVEEIVWRGFALALLARAISALPALVLTTIGFALAHTAIEGKNRLVHLATGGLFGGLYLLTGRLAAPIGAHIAYNILIALAIETRGSRAQRAEGRAVFADTSATTDRPGTSLRTGDALAELADVSKDYGKTRALDSVSMTVVPGEVVALLGPNGAGKTTAVSILLGIKQPDSGRARLFGSQPRSDGARRLIGVVPQDVSFPLSLRVGEVVDLVRAHFDDAEPRRELLTRFDVIELERRQTGGLSGGQRRRLALALAFAGKPRALFLDEPTAGLDLESRRSLWALLHDYAAAGGTILLTTHRLDEAEAIATRVIVLDRGQVLADGTVDALKQIAGLACVRLRTRQLPRLQNVERRERAGEVTTLYTRDAAALVTELVERQIDLTGIEVRPLSLEEAFLALTGRDGS